MKDNGDTATTISGAKYMFAEYPKISLGIEHEYASFFAHVHIFSSIISISIFVFGA